VYAAFLAGDIDRPKVRVFAQHLFGLTTEQIAIVSWCCWWPWPR
jgi:hypothetical protein